MTSPSAIRTITPVNTTIKSPQQIWAGGSGIQPLIVNNDPLHTLFIGSKADVARQDQSSCIPIEPLGSQVWGDYDIYAFAPVTVNTILVIPGATQWQPSPAQVAIATAGLATLAAQNTQIGQLSSTPGSTISQDIAVNGTPLLHGYDMLSTLNQVVSVPANSTVTLGTFTMSKPGYVIAIQSLIAAASTSPFMKVSMIWQDSTGSVILGQEDWWVSAGETGTGPWNHSGKGQVKGPQLQIKAFNSDAAAHAMSVTFTLFETTHPIARDDWRTISNPTFGANVNYFNGTAPGSILTDLCLISDRETINNGVDKVYLMPLYCGQIYLEFQTSAMNMSVAIGIPAQIGELNNPLLWIDATTSDVTVPLILPRCPCYIEFHNTSGANLGISANVSALEFAS